MIDYRYLKAFLYTAQYGSFSKAAEKLNIAQSAVSRQIKLLEESLKEELVLRSSKKVLLTQKGQKLYLATKRFHESTQDILEENDDTPLKIGILPRLVNHWFLLILQEYLQKEKRDLHIEIHQSQELITGLESEKYDLIISTDNLQTELISSLKLFDERWSLISHQEINVKQAHKYPWIITNDQDYLFDLFSKKSEQIIKVNSIPTIIRLVEMNLGIAIVPEHTLEKETTIHQYKMPKIKKAGIYLTSLNYKNLPSRIRNLSVLCKSL